MAKDLGLRILHFVQNDKSALDFSISDGAKRHGGLPWKKILAMLSMTLHYVILNAVKYLDLILVFSFISGAGYAAWKSDSLREMEKPLINI